MSYGTGYRPDPDGCRRVPFHHLKLKSSTLPSGASLFPGAPPVMDQAQSGACTGHASACGLYVALDLAWVPSPGEIYRNGRAIDRLPHADGSFDPLTDDGAQPNQVMRAINEFGVRPMTPLADRFSDVDTSTVNREPMLGDLETESTSLIVGDYGIYSTGSQRLTDIASAIANGHPVCCAIAGGSDAFQSYSGGVLGPMDAPLDHYVVLLEFSTQPDGTRTFGGRNSWGEGWGSSGNFYLSEAAVAELGDLIALDVKRSA